MNDLDLNLGKKSLASQKSLTSNNVNLINSLNEKFINLQKKNNLLLNQIQNLREILEDDKNKINILQEEKQQFQEKIHVLEEEKQQFQEKIHVLEEEKQQYECSLNKTNPVIKKGFIFVK